MFSLRIPFFKVVEEDHLLTHDIDGSCADSSDVGVVRWTDTTVNLRMSSRLGRIRSISFKRCQAVGDVSAE